MAVWQNANKAGLYLIRLNNITLIYLKFYIWNLGKIYFCPYRSTIPTSNEAQMELYSTSFQKLFSALEISYKAQNADLSRI
jgi:hypothetical protein